MLACDLQWHEVPLGRNIKGWTSFDKPTILTQLAALAHKIRQHQRLFEVQFILKTTKLYKPDFKQELVALARWRGISYIIPITFTWCGVLCSTLNVNNKQPNWLIRHPWPHAISPQRNFGKIILVTNLPVCPLCRVPPIPRSSWQSIHLFFIKLCQLFSSKCFNFCRM